MAYSFSVKLNQYANMRRYCRHNAILASIRRFQVDIMNLLLCSIDVKFRQNIMRVGRQF